MILGLHALTRWPLALYRTPPLRTLNCVVDVGVEHVRRRGAMYSGMLALRKMCATAWKLPLRRYKSYSSCKSIKAEYFVATLATHLRPLSPAES